MATEKVTENDEFCSAINPFALGEAVAGEKVNWDKESNPDAKLAEILGVKNAKVLFDSDSPILFPRTLKYNDSTEKVTVVSATKDVERLQNFYKKNLVTKKVVAKSKNVKQEELLQSDLRFSKVCSALFPNENVSLENSVLQKSAVKLDTSKSKSSKVPTIWKVMGDFSVNGLVGQEVEQGNLGDCYFMAALASVQWARPSMLNYQKLSNGNYKFCFWTKKLKAEWVTITQKVEVQKSNEWWLYGRSTTYNETWPALWEKAFAKWMTETSSDCPNMKKIEGGKGDVALRRLTGYHYDNYYCKSGNSDKIWRMLSLRTDSSTGKTIYPIAVNTSGKNRRDTVGTVPHHVYSVLGIEYYNGVKYIIVRNPWGSGHVKQYCRTGSWNGLTLNSNGVFSMRFDKFLEYFNYIYYV